MAQRCLFFNQLQRFRKIIYFNFLTHLRYLWVFIYLRMNFIVRIALKKDMVFVHQLITELAIFEKEPLAVEITVEDLEKDGFSAEPKFKIFIAEENGIIIGMALFYERYSTWKGKIIHLEDLIVTKSKRNLGVGKALYRTLMQYAYDNNFKRVAWEVLDWNINAIDFYQNTGANILKEWRVVHMNEQNLEKFIKN